jgi:hypothetical protein
MHIIFLCKRFFHGLLIKTHLLSPPQFTVYDTRKIRFLLIYLSVRVICIPCLAALCIRGKDKQTSVIKLLGAVAIAGNTPVAESSHKSL